MKNLQVLIDSHLPFQVCEMQTTSSRIWTWITGFIFSDGNHYIYIYIYIYILCRGVVIYIYIYIYIYILSASGDNGCGLFVYRIYKGFHINLWECSMYGHCYTLSTWNTCYTLSTFSCLYLKTHIQSVYKLSVYVIWRDEDYILRRNKFIKII